MSQEEQLAQLLDPARVRDQVLPKAREILEQKRALLSEREDEVVRLLEQPRREVQEWKMRVEALEVLADTDTDDDENQGEDTQVRLQSDVQVTPVAPPEPGSVLELVVEVVNRENRKIRSRDVREILVKEGHPVTANSVSNSLYYASRTAGRIQNLPERGWYAPLAYSETLIFDSNESARLDPRGRTVPTGDGTGSS